MEPATILYYGKSSIMMVFHLSMPIIVAATVVGLVIALLQTLIQLQEQTLGFACKLTAVVAVIMISGGWMTAELMQFQEQILTRISGR
ncbi:MAG: type III secretion system export apparatus subunit SctS [Pseudomonadota bacterium]